MTDNYHCIINSVNVTNQKGICMVGYLKQSAYVISEQFKQECLVVFNLSINAVLLRERT